MDRDAILDLHLLNVDGKFVNEKVDVMLRHKMLSDIVKASAKATGAFQVPKLYGAPQGVYQIEIDSPSYQTVNQFVNLKTSGMTTLQITLPIDPKKVKKINFPKYADLPPEVQLLLDASEGIAGFPEGTKGRTLYDQMDNIRRAGFSNIVAKTKAVVLSNGETVFPYLKKLIEVRGDRFFAFADKALRQEVKHSVTEELFSPVSSSLHSLSAKYADFIGAGSYKTHDRYGNLQLTFFTKGDDCLVDIDIDDAAGIEHIFQVVRNSMSGSPTNPYNIREILIEYQKLDPGYSFQV